jgi:lia operon protein LiaG
MRVSSIIIPLSLLATTAVAQQPERVTLEGSDVAVYNLAGAVTVEPGTGSVNVQVTRGGAAAARLTLEQGEIDGRETLRVRYPADRVLYGGMERGSSTELRVREDGTFGDGDYHHDDDDDHDHDRRARHEREGRRVRVSGSGEGLEAHADLRIQLPAGREAAIYLAVGKVSVANIDGQLRIDAHSAPVTATGTKGVLRVDVGSGTVNVSRAEGELSVDTGSGAVEISGFRGTELAVDTGSGEVTATDVQASRLTIDTGSGDIRVSGVTAPTLTLDTGSGGVTADLRAETAELTVETGSGNIAVSAPGSLGAELEIETASGDIETDFPLQVTRHSRDHLVGRIGNGKGRIAIETGSGDVRLLKRAS